MIFFLVVAASSYSSFFLNKRSLLYDIVAVHLLCDGGILTSVMAATRKAVLPSLMIYQVQKPVPIPALKRLEEMEPKAGCMKCTDFTKPSALQKLAGN